MASGKKERVMIACVTFEVAKIVDPAVFYESTIIHLIHYGEGAYMDFYNKVHSDLREKLPNATIHDHCDKKVFVFDEMMSSVLKIIRETQKEHPDSDIYVNVSAGTSEYTGAALIASMMSGHNIIPFNVASAEYQVQNEMMKKVYYENDVPVGLTKKCKEPNMLTTYTIQRPNETLVLGLKILDDQIKIKSTSATEMIPKLADAKLIEAEYENNGKPNQNTIMKYQRNFIDKWLDKGWIHKESKRTVSITEEGMTVLNVFYDSYSI